MNNLFKPFFFLLLFSSLFANEDFWEGDEYAKNSQSQKSSAEDFMENLQLEGIQTILDVGCGDGKITAALAKALPKGSVVGVDISSSMIECALKTFGNRENLTFEIQDAAELHFQERFDLITSSTVLQWVPKQAKVLEGFEKALKPGGKIWIQIPMGLPLAMQQALDKTLSNKRWKTYFTDFSPPWRFYQLEEYRTLLVNANLTPMHLGITTKHEVFPSRTAFQGFLGQWFPYLRPLPADLKEVFLTELLDNYLKIQPASPKGQVKFTVARLEVQAKK